MPIMDVRCEKCSTVYEFDDSRVGEQGVTVKCTQCGNLFKVKQRETTQETAMGAAAARSPAYIPPSKRPEPPPMQPARTTSAGMPVLGKLPTARAGAAPAIAPTLPDSGPNRATAPPHQPAPPGADTGWLIRTAAR